MSSSCARQGQVRPVSRNEVQGTCVRLPQRDNGELRLHTTRGRQEASEGRASPVIDVRDDGNVPDLLAVLLAGGGTCRERLASELCIPSKVGLANVRTCRRGRLRHDAQRGWAALLLLRAGLRGAERLGGGAHAGWGRVSGPLRRAPRRARRASGRPRSDGRGAGEHGAHFCCGARELRE